LHRRLLKLNSFGVFQPTLSNCIIHTIIKWKAENQKEKAPKLKPKTMNKISLLILALSFTAFAQAQQSGPEFTFNHLALSVKDVDRSAVFYSKVLNLQEITNKTKMEGIRWFSLGEGKELHLISILKENVTINKAVHIALTTSGFDSFIKTLDNMKIVYSDWPGTEGKINIRADGIKQVFFQDPDGYWIEVNSVGK
jgi:catechol 2,3-dioxygenase-like lactoylglutathione lyase family enzyme